MTAYTPNLPALIPSILSSSKDALPGDHTRAPQIEFERARQVLFLESLSATGSVRSAGRAGEGGGGFRRRSVLVSTSCQLRGLARSVRGGARGQA